MAFHIVAQSSGTAADEHEARQSPIVSVLAAWVAMVQDDVLDDTTPASPVLKSAKLRGLPMRSLCPSLKGVRVNEM